MNYFTVLVGLFTGSELLLLITKRSSKAASRDQSDKKSLLLLWLTISGALTAGTICSLNGLWMFPNQTLPRDTGYVLVILGLLIRWTSIVQLGKMFTVDVSISKAHQLNTSGLYQWIRHPSYLGLWLIIAGFGLLLGSVLSFFLLAVPVFFALHYRMNTEEKALAAAFGGQYADYKKKTYRLIPGIY